MRNMMGRVERLAQAAAAVSEAAVPCLRRPLQVGVLASRSDSHWPPHHSPTQADVRLLVDAEHSYFQPAIDNTVCVGGPVLRCGAACRAAGLTMPV